MTGLRRLRRSWRWLVVVAGVACLAALPAVVAALPARAHDVPPATLAAAGGTTHGYSGYVETTGRLGLPVLGDIDVAAALLSGPSKLRVWWREPTAWRVDLLSNTGETDMYGDPTGTWTWDSEARRVRRVDGEASVRLPRPADVVPPEVAERILAAAGPDELHALAAARVAGRSVPGVRVVPASKTSTIDHVDMWIDAHTGVALRVAVVARGGGAPAFETQFLDVSLSPPDPQLVTFTRPANTRTGRAPTDIVRQVASASPIRLPDTLAGLTRGPGQTGAVATYGDGFGVVGVVALPAFAIDQAIPDTIPLVDRPWGGKARVVNTSLVNAMAVSVDGVAYVLSGPVTIDELDRIAAVINSTKPGTL